MIQTAFFFTFAFSQTPMHSFMPTFVLCGLAPKQFKWLGCPSHRAHKRSYASPFSTPTTSSSNFRSWLHGTSVHDLGSRSVYHSCSPFSHLPIACTIVISPFDHSDNCEMIIPQTLPSHVVGLGNSRMKADYRFVHKKDSLHQKACVHRETATTKALRHQRSLNSDLV